MIPNKTLEIFSVPHFFFKLIPPRPTFSQDMTEAERRLMDEHVRYWKALQEQGFVLVYGPVFEAKGGWGMGIIEADDIAVAQDFAANDPTVKASLHTIEVSLMKAVLPENWVNIPTASRTTGTR